MTDREPEEPTVEESVSAALGNSPLARLSPDRNPTGGSVLAAVGGVRGLVESLLPGFMFLVLYTLTRDLWLAILVPLAISVLFVLARVVVKGQSLLAFAGLFGVGLSAAIALLTGRAENNFLWGFFVNGTVILVILVTIAMRRPLVGFIAGALSDNPSSWRAEPAKKRVALWASILILLVLLARLLVQVPLYLLGEEGVQALAATRLIMGLPLYAAALWVVWLMVRSVSGDHDATGNQPEPKVS